MTLGNDEINNLVQCIKCHRYMRARRYTLRRHFAKCFKDRVVYVIVNSIEMKAGIAGRSKP